MNINFNHLWSRSEDDIISILRNDNTLNLSITDISIGLFHRTKSSTASRIMRLKREKRCL